MADYAISHTQHTTKASVEIVVYVAYVY